MPAWSVPGSQSTSLPEHASAAGEDILDRVVEHVAECEDARDVRRRDDDGISRALFADARRIGFKALLIEPTLIPAVFGFARGVGLGQFGHNGQREKKKGRKLEEGMRFVNSRGRNDAVWDGTNY
jgi:hypothetical protein